MQFKYTKKILTYFCISETIEDLIVTASHAIFIRGRKKRSDELQAPVAVVGFQLLYTHFAGYIKNVIENVSF